MVADEAGDEPAVDVVDADLLSDRVRLLQRELARLEEVQEDLSRL